MRLMRRDSAVCGSELWQEDLESGMIEVRRDGSDRSKGGPL